jgi:hypothetical protein
LLSKGSIFEASGRVMRGRRGVHAIVLPILRPFQRGLDKLTREVPGIGVGVRSAQEKQRLQLTL